MQKQNKKGAVRYTGSESETPLSQSSLTALGQKATQENNEAGNSSPSSSPS